MRPTVSASIAAALTLCGAAPAFAADLVVQIDHSERVALSGSAASVFVGNASIIDAVLLDRRNLMVLGKGYGITNLVVIDGAGRTILNREVQVSPGMAGRMTLFRGASPNNFTCSPTCEHTPMPGEESATFSIYNPPTETYATRAKGGAGPAAP